MIINDIINKKITNTVLEMNSVKNRTQIFYQQDTRLWKS